MIDRRLNDTITNSLFLLHHIDAVFKLPFYYISIKKDVLSKESIKLLYSFSMVTTAQKNDYLNLFKRLI